MVHGEGPAALRCSRRGCESDAVVEVVWRNPRIHDESREKIWLSCDEHTAFFIDYLGARNFPVFVRPREVNE
jgi:hypothetical protein